MPPPTAVPTTPATAPQSGFAKFSQLPEMAAKQRALNGAKKPAFIPNAIKQQSQETQLFIFNVGPKAQEGSGASYGRVIIPACPAGAEYSEPYLVPGLPHEYYNKEGNTLDVQFHGDGDIPEPGFDWACQAIGGFTKSNGQWEGKFLHPGGSLERFGVGISRVWPPAKEDVALARKKMLAEYGKLVQAAREAHAVGKLSTLLAADGEFYFIAANALGLSAKTERWMEFSAPAAQETKELCPNCRKPYEPGTVVHDCNFVIDQTTYQKWIAEGRIVK